MSFDARTKQALNDVRAITPDEAEIQEAVNRFAPSTAVKRSYRLAKFGGLAAVAALAIAAITLLPTQANALDQMRQAMASVPASHTKYHRLNGEIMQEFWREGVKRRYRWTETIRIGGVWADIDRGYDGRNVWVVQANENKAVIDEEEPWGFGFDSTSVEEQMKGWTQKSLRTPLKVETETRNIDGQEFRIITVDIHPKEYDPYRQVFRCRLSDGLPIRIDTFQLKGGSPKPGGYATIDYPDDMDDSVFEFNPPAGLRVIDHRIARQQILDGLDGKAETKTVSGVPIDLLGAFESPSGNTFILWTGGATPHIDGEANVETEGGPVEFIMLPFQATGGDFPASADQMTKPIKAVQPPLHAHQDEPWRIEPYAVIEKTPVYAMQVQLQPSKSGQLLDVLVPVFKSGPRRVVTHPRGAMWESEGVPIGSARFKVKTVAVDNLSMIIRSLDKRGLSSSTTAEMILR